MECTENHHPANRLTDDLLISILSRLPVKFILQYKCISKAWHALISDGQRQKRLPCSMLGLFYHSLVQGWSEEYISLQRRNNDISVDTNLSFLPCSRYRIVDCCNGLLICHSSEGNSSVYYVCNPATKKWAVLPQPDYKFHLRALAFDPRISHHYNVLGFKVEQNSGSIIDIPVLFSSETRKWVEKRMPWHGGRHSYVGQHAFLNGSVHFLAFKEPIVVAIDLKRETYRKIELPGSKLPDDYLKGCLGQSQGYLHYAQQCNNQMMVWVLSSYDTNEWNLKHSISLEALFENQEVMAATLFTNRFYILVFHPELDIVFLKINLKLFSYHLISAKPTEISIPPGEMLPEFLSYTPCLLENIDL